MLGSMKRDLELIRKILLAVEARKAPNSLTVSTTAEIGYQVQLLLDSHSVEGKVAWDGVGCANSRRLFREENHDGRK